MASEIDRTRLADDQDAARPSVKVSVGRCSELPEGSMRLVRAGGHRICLARTASGVYALDNACPHQGYGLVQGDLSGDLLTCQWHNWKFRVDDGSCVLGEEGVRTYPVSIVDGDLVVEVVDPSPAEERARLWPSLRRGIEQDYSGQIARDVVRLLRNSANPAELVWEAVAWGAPRAEFGWGHALAMATDCLTIAEGFADDDRAFPIVQAIAGISEVEHLRPLRPQPMSSPTLPSDPRASFAALVEAQDADGAEALVLRALRDGVDHRDVQRWFIDAVSAHHLSFGHGAIYTQKAFELVDHLGGDRAIAVLPHLVPMYTTGTREDLLPYMRPAMKAVAALDLDALATAPDRRDTGWRDDGRLLAALLGPGDPPITLAARSVLEGAGVEGLLDTVATAASERLLRHDPLVDFDNSYDFGWLDITHALTYANAARWAWRHQPGVGTARLALYTVFMAHDSGRAEWRNGSRVPPEIAIAPMARDLLRVAATNQAGSFIVAAHIIKTALAAVRESDEIGSDRPRAAAYRFANAPRLERFVTAGTAEAIEFVRSGNPPHR